MENITYRTNLLQSVKVDDIVQKDMGSMDFGDFDFGEDQYYKCSWMDVGRPDRISKIIYGTSSVPGNGDSSTPAPKRRRR